MPKPNKKAPTRTVDIYCKACNYQLFKYRKGGSGTLIKCFKERIIQDYTSSPGFCPACDKQFARECLIRGTPAFKFSEAKSGVNEIIIKSLNLAQLVNIKTHL